MNTPAWPKPSQIKREKPWFKEYPDGRIVYVMTTKKGRDAYAANVRAMYLRQGKQCGTKNLLNVQSEGWTIAVRVRAIRSRLGERPRRSQARRPHREGWQAYQFGGVSVVQFPQGEPPEKQFLS